jgi:hypothetical protein
MDGADWLRTQLTSFGCAACGFAYDAAGIHVAAERDGLFFVDLACDMCGSSATAIVTVALDEEAAPLAHDPELMPVRATAATDGPIPSARRGERGPVDVDDLIDVHRVLAEWQGDLVGLLRRLDGAEGTVAR